MKTILYAITRKVPKSIDQAISQEQREKPDYKKTVKEHKQYILALKRAGLTVIDAPADDKNPDSIFVEDTYCVVDDKLVIKLNPGAPSRQTEWKSLRAYLPNSMNYVDISDRFTIDGGDILKERKTFYIGLSRRTQQEAIDEFASHVTNLGYHVKAVEVPQGLHLKSGMTRFKRHHYIIQESFLSVIQQLKAENAAIQYFVVPKNEEHAANILVVNNKLIMPVDCPITKEYFLQYFAAEDIVEVETDQVRLVDGAITCSNLLFSTFIFTLEDQILFEKIEEGIVCKLHKKKIDLRDEAGNSLLMAALQKNQLKAVDWLLENHINIYAKNKLGLTALHYAYKSTAHIQKLINLGLNVNEKDREGMTPLMWAAMHHDIPAMKCLIHNSANVNVKSTASASCLSYTLNGFLRGEISYKNTDEIIKLFLHAGFKDSLVSVKSSAQLGEESNKEVDALLKEFDGLWNKHACASSHTKSFSNLKNLWVQREANTNKAAIENRSQERHLGR